MRDCDISVPEKGGRDMMTGKSFSGALEPFGVCILEGEKK